LIRETTENESANEGYRFGQEEETYNIVAAHGYFGRLIFHVKVVTYAFLQVSDGISMFYEDNRRSWYFSRSSNISNT
jgi:hypothetical protein